MTLLLVQALKSAWGIPAVVPSSGGGGSGMGSVGKNVRMKQRRKYKKGTR